MSLEVAPPIPRRPSVGGLSTTWLVGIILALLALIGGIVAYSAWPTARARPAAAAAGTQVGFGGVNLDGNRTEETTTTTTTTRTTPGTGVKAERDMDVFGIANRFEDPNKILAQREIDSWTAEDLVPPGPAPWGCSPRDGAELVAQQANGVLRVLRALSGTDPVNGKRCVAVQAGASVLLARPGQEGERLCAVRIEENAPEPDHDLGCWEVTGRSGADVHGERLYYIRATSGIRAGG